jgi:hypothetical protein
MSHDAQTLDARPSVQRRPLFRISEAPLWIPPALAVGWILLALAAIWLVDVRGAFGGPEALMDTGLDPAYVWFQLFMDGGITELLQWAALGALIVLASVASVAHRARASVRPVTGVPDPERRSEGLAACWALFAVMAVLMLVEDAGNPRHLLTHYVGVITGFSSAATMVAEMLYFATIAGIGVYAVTRFGRDLLRASRTRTLGAVGVAGYGLAAAMSATRNVGDWYIGFGGWLVDDVFAAPQLVAAVPVGGLDEWDLRFMFVDFVVEESLELLGAAFLLAAVLAHLRQLGWIRGAGVELDP